MQQLFLGKNRRTKETISIDIEKVMNHHGIIFGASGSGKTYTMRGLAKGFATISKSNRCIIFDVHGDILPKSPLVSTVKIEETSKIGIQPLKINTNKEYGGVNRAIKRFIYSINSTTTKLGTKQEAALRSLLVDLYASRGFYADRPETWSIHHDTRVNPKWPKKHPSFEDLLRYAKSKQEELYLGASTEVVKKFNAFAKKSRALQVKISKEGAGAEEGDDDLLTEEKNILVDVFAEFVHDNSRGMRETIIQDQIKYSSFDVVTSVINRLESLYSTGIFKNGEIVFDSSRPIHRYDLSSLGTDDQKVFINMAMSNLYLELRERGFGGRADTFVFIDEAKNYIDDSDDNMIMKFFNEIRKYGCGLWLGGQNISHFNDDIVTNAATKIILGVDKLYSKAFAQRLQIDISMLNGIIPKKTFIAEIKEDGKHSGFVEVEVA